MTKRPECTCRVIDSTVNNVEGVDLKPGEFLGKFGETHGLKTRMQTHKHEIGAGCNLVHIEETPDSVALETAFKKVNI